MLAATPLSTFATDTNLLVGTANRSALARLPSEAQQEFDALLRTIKEADGTKLPQARQKLLREFMAKSWQLANACPDLTNLWMRRMATAVELEYPETAWLSGKHLQGLGLAKNGDTQTQKMLGQLSVDTVLGGLNRDMSDWESSRIEASANDGDVEAQRYLAECYEEGANGFTRDRAQALSWERNAAEGGLASAQFKLGQLYRDGKVVDKNEAEAAKWFRHAAEAGHRVAQRNLGILYREGKGVSKDKTEAAKLFLKAAAAGDDEARNCSGEMYEDDKNYTEALKWYRRAARKGNARAMQHLAFMYESGLGVGKSETVALRWKSSFLQATDPQSYILYSDKFEKLLKEYDYRAEILEDERDEADSGSALAANDLAWTMATSPEAKVRNSNEAVKYAFKACEATYWNRHPYIDTLAAAYAEAGKFADAVKYERLKLYEEKKPYRDAPRTSP
jgi:TPR repeat protein